tara:strand:+ start:527 stop:1453 length:927 start_codon:yes stop_codon:yes gene_type:complete
VNITPKKFNTFSIAVVVPTKNRHEDLSIFFDSLLKQSVLPNQIIVIDQSEENLSEELIKKKVNTFKSSRLTYIYNKDINGLVEAKNYSLQYNKSDLICFLEDDEVLEEDFLEQIIIGFRLNPLMKGCCGVITNPPNKNFSYELFFHLFHIGLYKDIRVGIYGYKSFPNKFILSDKLSGGLSAWKKEVFSDVFFDLKNNLHFTEDIDFSSRVFDSFPDSLFINTDARLAHYFSKSNRFNIIDRYSKKVLEYIIFYKKRKKYFLSNLHLLWLLVGIFFEASLKSLLLLSFSPVLGYFHGLYNGLKYKLIS